MSFETLEINGKIHEDPYNQKQIGDLSLYVDWKSKTASIEEMDHGITFDVYHGIHSVYNLPGAVDIENFKENVYPRIIPLLGSMANAFEVYWDGNNHRGRFNMDQEEQYQIESDILYECQAAPEIDGIVVFDVDDTCAQPVVDIPEFFENGGHNFLDVDIDKMDIEEIKEMLAGDESIWLCDDEEIKESLKGIQEELQEINEEEY